MLASSYHEPLFERSDMLNALAVSMTDRLALKLALRTQFDNQPARVAVPVLGGGTPALVSAELDELDNTFTAAVVVNF